MRKCSNISPCMRRPGLVIYDFATMLHSEFPHIYEENLIFFLYQCTIYIYRELGSGAMGQPWTIQIGGLASQKLALSGTVWSCMTINFG